MKAHHLFDGSQKNNVQAAAQTLRAAMLKAVGPDEMLKVVKRHLELIYQNENLAVAHAAIESFYSRFIGKPRESLDVEINTTHTLDATALPTATLRAIAQILEQPAPSEVLVIDQRPQQPEATGQTRPDMHDLK